MKLSRLLYGVEVIEIIGLDTEIENMSHDSKKITRNGLFFCIKGLNADGHDYAIEAQNNGADAVICERKLDIAITQIIVKDVRSAMAEIAGNFYNNPIKTMKLIGVTGTNGKTTTTYILKSIGEAAGKKVGLIGTSGIIIDGKMYPPILTTPDPLDLHKIFRQMADCNTDWIVMEVSAHALDLRKMDGITADIAVLTNCTQDHLDYFKTLENYRNAKNKFFRQGSAKMAVVNIDDDLGLEISRKCPIACFTYGCDNPADAFGIDYISDFGGLRYIINIFDKVYDINFALPGKFNMYNTLCASLTAYLLNVDMSYIAEGIEKLKLVKGRFQKFSHGDKQVVIDYAHTPDGLNKVLNCIKEFATGRIITVFGCGGDRDKDKRAKMGNIAGSLSDFTVITSDNPRSEEPESIISEIELGIIGTKKQYICITNRYKAIRYAWKLAKKDDIILIAGKGDEETQEIKGVKYPFSDLKAVKKLVDGENF